LNVLIFASKVQIAAGIIMPASIICREDLMLKAQVFFKVNKTIVLLTAHLLTLAALVRCH
jgi:hypothetical protein